MKPVLVIAAHPDDEVLGCGGAVARHVDHGDEVHLAILAEGVTSRDESRDRHARTKELSLLAACAQKSAGVLGAKSISLHDFPDNRMDSMEQLDINKFIEGLVGDYKPEILYTHHAGDVNIDHRRIHEGVVTACRPMPGNHIVKTILFFETASSTEWQPPGSGVPFEPDWFVDITDTLDRKLEALEKYESEMRPWPHARSIEAVRHLARWRGASIGVEAAEAFMLGRRLILK